MHLGAIPGDDPNFHGQDLTPAIEQNGTLTFRETSTGSSVTIAFDGLDPTEIYSFLPTNGQALYNWASTASGAVTMVIYDGDPNTPDPTLNNAAPSYIPQNGADVGRGPYWR